MPRVVTPFLPSADHVVALVQHGQQLGNLVRIILQVGIERQDKVAASRRDPSTECRRLAEVPPKTDPPHLRVARADLLNDVPRIISGTIVDQ